MLKNHLYYLLKSNYPKNIFKENIFTKNTLSKNIIKRILKIILSDFSYFKNMSNTKFLKNNNNNNFNCQKTLLVIFGNEVIQVLFEKHYMKKKLKIILKYCLVMFYKIKVCLSICFLYFKSYIHQSYFIFYCYLYLYNFF